MRLLYPVCVLVLTAAPLKAADCGAFRALDAFAAGGASPVGATCDTYLTQTGETGHSCHWKFGLRDPQAMTFARFIWSEAAACRPGQALATDKAVNHPDSYALRQWQAEGATYAISVKDKGGLGHTFVFVRREPR